MGIDKKAARAMNPNNIVEGMAEILWAMAWADHVEEHGCADISGCEITEVMPEIPAMIYARAERYMGQIVQANGTNEHALFYAALKADGLDPHKMHEGEDLSFYELETRFGNCLGHMVCGSGVSWFDDHERFELKVPHCDSGECRGIADELCDEEVEDDDEE